MYYSLASFGSPDVPTPRPLIICLLDDEPSVLKALGRLLASVGLLSERFSDPPRFLEYVRHHPVRLAIIDLHLPGMTGLEVLAELRVTSPDTRVIVMTGDEDPGYRSAAMAGGAFAFFLKSSSGEPLLAAVQSALA